MFPRAVKLSVIVFFATCTFFGCSNSVMPTDDGGDASTDEAIVITDAASADADPGRRPGLIRIELFYDQETREAKVNTSVAFFARTPGRQTFIDGELEGCKTREFLGELPPFVDAGEISLLVDERVASPLTIEPGFGYMQRARVLSPPPTARIGLRVTGSTEVPAFEVSSIMPPSVTFGAFERGIATTPMRAASAPLELRWTPMINVPDAMVTMEMRSSTLRVTCSAPLSGGALDVAPLILQRLAPETFASFQLGVWRRSVLRVGEHTIEFDMRNEHASGRLYLR